MLGVLWQICRLVNMKAIALSEVPEIYRLLNEGEELSALQKMKPEDILIRWMNFHLPCNCQLRFPHSLPRYYASHSGNAASVPCFWNKYLPIDQDIEQ